MPTPLITLTLCYSAGLLFGHGFLYFPYFVIVFLAFLLVAASGLIWTNRLTGERVALFLLPLCLGMAAYVFSVGWHPRDHVTDQFPRDRKLHEIVGTITSPLDREPDRTAFVVALSRIDGAPVSGLVKAVSRTALSTVGLGDTIRIRGKLSLPGKFSNPRGFDYPDYLARSDIHGLVRFNGPDEVQILFPGNGLSRTIQDWRERIRQAFLLRTSEPASAILQAMVLGEEGSLTDELRDLFMAAGVTHIISISGSHLGMVAVLCFAFIRGSLFLLPERWYHIVTLYGDPKKIAAVLTLPLLVFYTLLAGGQIATIRSLILILSGLLALLLDRDHALMHALSLAALILLVAHPQAIFDISFQFSFLSVLVIGSVVGLWKDLGLSSKSTLQRLRNGAVLLIVISAAAGAATAPLAAYYFNQVSFAGIIANMIVVPLAGMIVVPLGLLSGVLSLFFQSLPFAFLNQTAADAFISVVTLFARLPFAQAHLRAPGLLWLLCYFLLFASAFAIVRSFLLVRFKPLEVSSRRPTMLIAIMASSAVLLLLLTVPNFLPEMRTTVRFLDVGQGDCALITVDSGKRVLIDGGGTRDNRFDIGRRVVAPYLWNLGIHKLDLVVLSHPHPDHRGGLAYIANNFDVREIWTSGLDNDVPGYPAFLQLIEKRGILIRRVSAQDPTVGIGDDSLTVLHPSSSFTVSGTQAFAEENNRSLVVRFAAGGTTFLFSGDIGAAAEDALVRSREDLKCDVLKVPHHGSKSSSSTGFLERVKPTFAVISVGRDNPYHHPSDEVLARYAQQGTTVLRTDRDGAIAMEKTLGGLKPVRWNDLVMNRIDLRNWKSWGDTERSNGSRLLLRKAAF